MGTRQDDVATDVTLAAVTYQEILDYMPAGMSFSSFVREALDIFLLDEKLNHRFLCQREDIKRGVNAAKGTNVTKSFYIDKKLKIRISQFLTKTDQTASQIIRGALGNFLNLLRNTKQKNGIIALQ